MDLRGSKLIDLSLLARFKELAHLELRGSDVTDVSLISRLKKLKKLDLSGTKVSDLSPLADLSVLESLDLSETQVSDLSPLAGLIGLKGLDISGTHVNTVLPIAPLRNLRILHLNRTSVTDLSPLVGLSALEVLHISETGITDISPLSALSGLKELNLSGTEIDDVSSLSGLADLDLLYLSKTKISNVSSLQGLKRLRSLYIDESDIRDVSALRKIEDLKIIGMKGVGPVVEALAQEDVLDINNINENPACVLSGRFKLVFDTAQWLEKIQNVVEPAVHFVGSSSMFNFLAVAKPEGVSDDRFLSALDALCRDHGGRRMPDFGYDLDDDPIDDSLFLPESNPGNAGVGVHTLNDVLRANGIKGVHNSLPPSDDVILAIVDTGIEGSRPEFAVPFRRAGGWAARGEDPWVDTHGHGTMCASIASGVAPRSPLMACRSAEVVSGKVKLVDSDLAMIYERLIEMARQGKTLVVNNSFGIRTGTPPTGMAGLDFPLALDAAIKAGVHVVFSAGNYHTLAGGVSGACTPNSIWQYKGRADVLTVGACDMEGRVWDYSSRGPGQFFGAPNTSPKPDVVAPVPAHGRIARGVEDKIGPWGTSGAAPQVAGLLALLLAARSDLPRRQLYDAVRKTADNLAGYGPFCQGKGRVHGGRALEYAKGVLPVRSST